MKYSMYIIKPHGDDYFPYDPSSILNWDIRFFSDPNDISSECDVLVLYEKIDKDVRCRCKIAIFVVGEPSDMRFYPTKFLSYFDFYLKSGFINNRGHYNNFLALPCHLKRGVDSPKSNFIYHDKLFVKSRSLSCISSTKCMTSGHMLRVKFINRLMKLDVDIDYFGKGYKFIKDKSEGLQDYRFSLVIENKKERGYLTEKFTDAILSETIPIYYGCGETALSIAPGAFIEIDITDFKEALRLIKHLEENADEIYDEMYSSVKNARSKILYDLTLPQNLIALILSKYFLRLRGSVAELRVIKSPVGSLGYRVGFLVLRIKRYVERIFVNYM